MTFLQTVSCYIVDIGLDIVLLDEKIAPNSP